MQFILIIMFFVTPPTLGKNRLWALQSTQTIEFESWLACDDAIRNVILPAIKSTDTMALTAWCLPRAYTADARVSFLKGETKFLTEEVKKNPNAQFGTCYDYVPPAVGERKSKDQRSITVEMIGKCHKN